MSGAQNRDGWGREGALYLNKCLKNLCTIDNIVERLKRLGSLKSLSFLSAVKFKSLGQIISVDIPCTVE